MSAEQNIVTITDCLSKINLLYDKFYLTEDGKYVLEWERNDRKIMLSCGNQILINCKSPMINRTIIVDDNPETLMVHSDNCVVLQLHEALEFIRHFVWADWT